MCSTSSYVDERHVFAGLHHMCAGIAADRARSDKRNLTAHAALPASSGERTYTLAGI
jgi:hypothetical protein